MYREDAASQAGDRCGCGQALRSRAGRPALPHALEVPAHACDPSALRRRPRRPRRRRVRGEGGARASAAAADEPPLRLDPRQPLRGDASERLVAGHRHLPGKLRPGHERPPRHHHARRGDLRARGRGRRPRPAAQEGHVLGRGARAVPARRARRTTTTSRSRSSPSSSSNSRGHGARRRWSKASARSPTSSGSSRCTI